MSTNRPPSRNRSVLVVLLALSVSCFAAEPPKELTALKENFAKALERTTKPLQSAYETELRKLIEKHTKAGEFDAAVAVKTELVDAVIEAMRPGGLARHSPSPVSQRRFILVAATDSESALFSLFAVSFKPRPHG